MNFINSDLNELTAAERKEHWNDVRPRNKSAEEPLTCDEDIVFRHCNELFSSNKFGMALDVE